MFTHVFYFSVLFVDMYIAGRILKKGFKIKLYVLDSFIRVLASLILREIVETNSDYDATEAH